MKLADVSIRRPVFAFMMTIALVVLGLFSYRTLGLDLMPKTDYPMVTVTTRLSGASAEEIETQLTKPVEEVVNTINGIDELRASSDQGSSRVTITFVLERDIEAATQDVRDKVATVVGRFPRDTVPPTIQKMDPDSSPILTLVVSGQRSQKEISEITNKKIKEVIETVQDVGEVTFMGERRREIQLLLNADRLNAYGLTVERVRSAVDRQNVEIPGGTFVAGPSEIAMRTMGRIKNVDDFNRIILAYGSDGSVIRFSDIGRVVDTVPEIRYLATLDGNPCVTLMIRKQSGTNTVEVVDRVLAKLEALKSSLPTDFRIVPIRDQSRFIRRSVSDIQHHLILGGLLASLVVFLFIRNIRTTLIAAVAIPASIIGTFTAMRAFGFTLNNMTMLALSLATGIVIDDAIVVLENIFRYVEERGASPREAASKATAEIGMAVMATTLSLVVIFLPVAYMTGQVGQYFFSFGIVSASAILLSMFISFTLTPALCATWMRPRDVAKHAKSSKSRGAYAAVDRGYGHLLRWAMGHRIVMVAIALAVTASAVYLFPRVGKELVPDDDQSEFSVNVRLPRGTSYLRTKEFVDPIEADIRNLGPEVQMILANISPGSANYYVALSPLEGRNVWFLSRWGARVKSWITGAPYQGIVNVSQQEMMRRARAMLRKYKGVRASVSGGTDLSGASSAGGRGGGGGGGGMNRVSVLIQGPDIEQLQIYVTDLMERLKTVPGLVDIDTNFEPTQQELRVNVDRARAADLGVAIDSLASSMGLLVGGNEVSKYKEGDEQFSVKLRLDEQFRNDPKRMGELLIPSAAGTVKVSDVAQLTLEKGPASIDRYNRQRQISVTANLDRIPLQQAIEATQAKVDELRLRPGYQAVFGGSARTLAEASTDFVIAIVLAIAFIYMVLASQFNSFVYPLSIMTALPLSLPAGLLALMAFGMTVNVYSAIGLMMLFGIVKKNSILQVDYTNTLRAQGMERHEAILVANHVRLRPILMTTISIIAGMLPIAFGRGAGAGSRASMAVTIIGGQILCLLLTLLITPVIYSYFDDLREWHPARLFAWMRRAGKAPAAAPPPEPLG
jgi:HAE1 family hydrophobic/amphiphilic exporter-1